MGTKTAIIVGGSGGIGAAAAHRLARDGFTVCATYATHAKTQLPQQVERYPLDVTDREAVFATLREIIERHGAFDVLVYSVASPIVHKRTLERDWAEFSRQLDVQVHGFLNIVQGCGPLIAKRHPLRLIVLLTEACTGKPPAQLADYVSAKYALQGLAKTLAIELAPSRTSVNMVSPGLVPTALTEGFPERLFEMAAAANPLRRNTTPEDVANAIAFLASDDAADVNGADLLVNGGSNLS